MGSSFEQEKKGRDSHLLYVVCLNSISISTIGFPQTNNSTSYQEKRERQPRGTIESNPFLMAAI